MKTLHAIEVSALPGSYLIDIFPSLLHIPKVLSKWKQEGDHWYHENTSMFEQMLAEVRQKREQVSIDRYSRSDNGLTFMASIAA